MSYSSIAGIQTTAVRGGRGVDSTHRPLVSPLVPSTTFVQEKVGGDAEFAYSRVSNPTVSDLEKQLGALEEAEAICFASGLAAETALLLATVKAGDHVVCGDAVYGGTVRLLGQVFGGLGVETTFVDCADVEAVRGAVRANTALILAETPANPTLKLTDLPALASIAQEAGVLYAVDNTFMTPVLQQPLDLGADVTVYSTTKHIEGHSSAVGGAVLTRDAALGERLRFIRKCTGAIQSPFGAWITGRGVKTLPIRIERQSQHAQRVAEGLEANEFVGAVYYPGLASFPQAELAERQHNGLHGGVLAFEVIGGTQAAVRVLEAVELCVLAEHMGSVDTLITHPATMTHADVPVAHRHSVGITDGLIRLSVGLEAPADILADLERAIALAHKTIKSGGPRCAAVA